MTDYRAEITRLAARSDLNADDQEIMVNAAMYAKWTPEQFARIYYNICRAGRDPAIEMAAIAYDL